MKEKFLVYWCRRDFRLTDNPALSKAIDYANKHNLKIIPIFIIDSKQIQEKRWNIGYPRRKLLSKILADFAINFPNFQIYTDDPINFFKKLFNEYQVTIFANSDIEPYARIRDGEITKLAQKNNSKAYFFQDQLSIDPATKSKTGSVYSVFSPFRNAVLDSFLNSNVCNKINLNEHKHLFENNQIESEISPKIKFNNLTKANSLSNQIFELIDEKWQLTLPEFTINLDEILERPKLDNWYYNENQAIQTFEKFNLNKIKNYKIGRDSLDLDIIDDGQTSKISTALKWGLISPRFIIIEIQKRHDVSDSNVFSYVSELIWREFYRYILYHNPNNLSSEFQEKYRNKIVWVGHEIGKERFLKWIKGETGYEVVDAAMNQISQTGWMHNRSRMIAASILTKNLGVDWRWGQEYFRSVLVDLDEASNNGGWQWASSVGSDPKPIRIFNPYTQQEKFDPEKKYIKKWLPKNYNITEPIIDHKQARLEGLERYKLAKDAPARDY